MVAENEYPRRSSERVAAGASSKSEEVLMNNRSPINRFFTLSAVVSMIATLSACEGAPSPTESLSPRFLKGATYRGTFSVTFNNYENYYFPLTQSGSISIQFFDYWYSYSAKVSYTSSTFGTSAYVYEILADKGSYSKSGNKIEVYDVARGRFDGIWHNSLYMDSIFTLTTVGKQLVFSQNNSFADWSFRLVRTR